MGRSAKQDKEAHVTGHTGTTAFEVVLVSLAAPIGLACHAQVQRHLQAFLVVPPGKNLKLLLLFLEGLLVWFPMLLVQTVYLYPWGILVMVLQSCMVLVLRQWSSSSPSTTTLANKSLTATSKPRLDYLTLYRSSLLFMTFIAILAVDFHVFPRRFCKTETQGFGLMDVGAASFSLSAGLVTSRARHRHHHHHKGSSSSMPLQQQQNRWKPLIRTVPLLVIGLVRILLNQELEYQEHVSEYGVHWNYFFTMGVVALVTPLIPTPPPTSWNPFRSTLWMIPTLALVIYQLVLSLGGGQEYIEDAPRQCPWQEIPSIALTLCHLVAANREGIFGSIGYVSLHLAGEWVGQEYLFAPPPPPTTTPTKKNDDSAAPHRYRWQVTLSLWIVLLGLHHGAGMIVSRRSTNALFCLWAFVHNLLLLDIMQWLFPPSTNNTAVTDGTTTSATDAKASDQEDQPLDTTDTVVPMVWGAVNRHGLAMFLVANILTGLVNLLVPTLEVSNTIAMIAMCLYMTAIGLAALALDWVLVLLGQRRGRQRRRPSLNAASKKD